STRLIRFFLSFRRARSQAPCQFKLPFHLAETLRFSRAFPRVRVKLRQKHGKTMHHLEGGNTEWPRSTSRRKSSRVFIIQRRKGRKSLIPKRFTAGTWSPFSSSPTPSPLSTGRY